MPTQGAAGSLTKGVTSTLKLARQTQNRMTGMFTQLGQALHIIMNTPNFADFAFE